jgi:two-component system sensor histidine kinase PhcS
MQLVQSEKMSSLGRFSAGLMHDILNPLNYSRTGLFVLRKNTRSLPPGVLAETDAILNDIEDGLKRVDNIVSDLRTFTHPGVQASEAVDLADIFNLSLRFVSSELKEKNISLELDLEPGQKVWASRNHFILVVVNLLENAIDALGEKHFADGARPAIEISGRTEDERSLLFIRDNGPGIAPENLAKIFDPFFTTKEVGKGTGLGLSICFGIVHGYGGTISAMSEPGQFCEFTLDLPATAKAAAKTKPEHAEPLRL